MTQTLAQTRKQTEIETEAEIETEKGTGVVMGGGGGDRASAIDDNVLCLGFRVEG